MIALALSPMASLSGATSDNLGLSPAMAISLNVNSLDFGDLTPGEVSDTFEVNLTNDGDDAIDVHCDVADNGEAALIPGVVIDNLPWGMFSTTLSSKESKSVNIHVQAPISLSPGKHGGDITFWASGSSGGIADKGDLVDWPTFQGNNHHTGVTSEEGPTSGISLRWSTFSSSTGMAGFDTAPIAANGTLYMISNKGSVIAYDAGTGSVRWERTNLVISTGMGFQLSTPAYNDGVLYAAVIMGSGKGVGVFALNAADGSTVWAIPELVGGYSQPNTPIIYDEGRIYLGYWFSSSAAGKYTCINATDGSIIWQRQCSSAASYYWAGAAIIGDYLVYGDEAGNVTAVNKLTGIASQEFSAGDMFDIPKGKIRSSMSYSTDSEMIFFTIQSGYCCAIGFDESTGRFDSSKKWAAPIGFSTSTPAVYGGKVYVGTGEFTAARGSNLLCLNEVDGAVQWNFTAEGGVQSSPVISIGHDDEDGKIYIYFTTNLQAGSVYCLDGGGSVMWRYAPTEDQQQYTLQGVVIYNGTVYFGNDAGYVFALGGEL
jgi:outer membrane protein assembly factor BamB